MSKIEKAIKDWKENLKSRVFFMERILKNSPVLPPTPVTLSGYELEDFRDLIAALIYAKDQGVHSTAYYHEILNSAQEVHRNKALWFIKWLTEDSDMVEIFRELIKIKDI